MESKLKYFVFVLSIVLVFGDQLNDVNNGEPKNAADDKNNATSVSDTPDSASATTASANNADIKKVSRISM